MSDDAYTKAMRLAASFKNDIERLEEEVAGLKVERDEARNAAREVVEHLSLANDIVNEAINEAAGAIAGISNVRPGDRVAAVVARLAERDAARDLLADCADLLREHYSDEDVQGDPPQRVPSPALRMETRIRDYLGGRMKDSEAVKIGVEVTLAMVKAERDALRAQNARLREALMSVSRQGPCWCHTAPAASDTPHDDHCKAAFSALAESPAAALDALKREVAERVREACLRITDDEPDEWERDEDGVSEWDVHSKMIRALDLSALLAEARHE